MNINNDVVEAIGNTPLIKLKRASEATGCTILGKAEFMNPGQSVKDRAGKWMILEAEKRGDLKPGGLVVEFDRRQYRHRPCGGRQRARLPHADPDPGNPEPGKEGHAAAVRRRTGRSAGAALLPIRTTISMSDGGSPTSCARTSRTACCSPTSGTTSTTPRRITNSTGPEIWEQTGGKIDGFICSVGTGGTLAGTSRYPEGKEQGHRRSPAPIRMALRCTNCSRHGEAKSTPGDSITEGIGLGRVTPVIETAKVDDAFLIPDEEAVTVIYDLLEHEGLCLGGSTGINVAGAIRLAKQLGPGKTIVTILCDSGNRYQSKLFNPEFMRSKNLPVPEWLEKRTKIDVPFEKV